MFWVKKKLRKLPPYISFYIAHQTLLREFTLTHGNHFHQRFEWSWFGTEAQSYVMSLGSHICLPLKYSFHSLLLLCGEAVTSAETEGVISLGWPGVHAWRSPMGLGARWYGPGEWLPSPGSGFLKFSNSGSCRLPFGPLPPRLQSLTAQHSLTGRAFLPGQSSQTCHCPNHRSKVMTHRTMWWASFPQP